MAINALNSGARVWLADLEDANTPHWSNVITGQLVLRDAVRRKLRYVSPDGRNYELRPDRELAVMVVRPRGWHFDEQHVMVDGVPAVAAFVDFGLHFFHNAAELLQRGSGPYYYLPKTESHLEIRLWNDVFTWAQERLGIPYGTIRATVLIETITAAFEMNEILYELRDHASGLNAGRWDYLFSMIKNFRDAGPTFVLPDRGSVTMTAPPMRAYTELRSTCHRRRLRWAAWPPSFQPTGSGDQRTLWPRFGRTRSERRLMVILWLIPTWCRCAARCSTGCWATVRTTDRHRDDVEVTQRPPRYRGGAGPSDRGSLRNNIDVGLRYLEAWLGGNGAASTISWRTLLRPRSRSQIGNGAQRRRLDRRTVTADLGGV
jgi:malate synthase